MNLTPGKRIIYALGQFGLVLSAFGVGTLFVTFFVTRSWSDSVFFPSFIYPGYVFGLFTIAGLVIALAKVVDACAVLFFGYASDRNPMKRGRRSGFMYIAAIPVSVLSFLVFFPPVPGSYVINSLFVLGSTILFYIFLSLYSAPYLALLSELGASPRDRLVLSTMLASATALASLLGNRIFFFMEKLESVFSCTSLESFRIILVLYALVSAVCLMLPVLLIDERAHCSAEPVKDSFHDAILAVAGDSYFRSFVFADIMFRIASGFIMAGFMYYTTTLLALSQRVASFFVLIVFFGNLLLFFPVSILTRKIGKKKILLAAFFFLMVVLSASVFAGKYPLDPFWQGISLSILVAIPFSVFTVVPNALVSDLVYASERKTGIQRGGMYFGVYSLAVKSGTMFASLVCPFVMALGASYSHDTSRMGLRITMLLSAFFAFSGFVFLLGYREKEVTVLLEEHR